MDENVEAGLRYAEKCMKMRGRWVMFNHMTERLEYLHVRKCHRERFSERWSRHIEMQKYGGGGDGGATSSSELGIGSGEQTPAMTPAKRPAAKAKADSAKKQKAEDDGGSLKKLLQEAFKVKVAYTSAHATASTLLRSIEQGGAWEWAQHTKFHQELKDLLAAADAKINSDTYFMEILTTATSAELKAAHKSDGRRLLQALTQFLEMKEIADTMVRSAVRLQNMHKATA